VAGDRVQVVSLLPIGADPHSYQPSPQDVARITDAGLIILNGAEYERFLAPMLENAEGGITIVEASAGLSLRREAQGGHGVDPHLWLDPNNVILYVENIREGLTHFDPEGAAEFRANAEAYTAELTALNAWIEEQVKQIPADNRLLVTNHEAFGYFAGRYGFTVAGTVVESFSTDASPSAQQMAGLIDQIRSMGAPAIFMDAGDNPALARQIADEAGVGLVSDLHLESLTDGAPAGTYIDMMKYNVTRIVGALN
jgi:ABC-type Zn uptake system ZnuABC Zn-binding protein ZnuA